MARNPILAQRELREKMAAEAAKLGKAPAAPNSPPPPPSSPDAPAAPPKATPQDPREILETFPDEDLHQKASALPDYDSAWDRETLITKLIEAGTAE